MTRRRLTHEQFAGDPAQPCAGCGQPIADDLGDWPAWRDMTDDEKAERVGADAVFTALHQGHGSRWSFAGSRSVHCSLCCPVPIPSPAALRQVADLIRPDLHSDLP